MALDFKKLKKEIDTALDKEAARSMSIWIDRKRCVQASCCCKCSNRVDITCHPSNKEIGKGPISEHLGYGCSVFSRNRVIFMENGHGGCELFNQK